VILQHNWLREAEKFFDQLRLSIKLWTWRNWRSDKNECTVWIVKVSWLRVGSVFHQLVSSDRFKTSVEILSSWSDECHLFSRSATSVKNDILRDLCLFSRFNVLISGTLFPLGPSTDAKGLLHSLGGPFNEKGRWKEPLKTAFFRLLGNNKFDNPYYDVLALRILIAPFTLRRISSSTWEQKWVIQRTVTRPKPVILMPYPDTLTEDARNKFRLKYKHKQSEAKIIDRADKQRFFAWTPIYEEFMHARNHNNDQKSDMRLMEEVIVRHFRTVPLSGRMKRFIAFVKEVKRNGDKFIVVSDRLFPLVLAFYVLSKFVIALIVHRFANSYLD
jgi:hypothetical protein